MYKKCENMKILSFSVGEKNIYKKKFKKKTIYLYVCVLIVSLTFTLHVCMYLLIVTKHLMSQY